jgi:hypothetical protein
MLLLSACSGKDGDDLGSEGGDSSTNHVPSAPEIVIDPDDPDTTEDLVVVIKEHASDSDDDPLSYRYKWKQDGAVRSDLSKSTVASVHTRRGETWTVVVVAHDGVASGPEVTQQVEIENSLPVLSSVTITPSEVYEITEVECLTGDVTDDDHDLVGVMTRWMVNGEELEVEGPLTGDHFEKGDEIVCVAYMDDGAETVTQKSRAVFVQNAAPWVVGVTLSSNNPTPDDVLEAIPEGWWDDDGDEEGYLYAWYINWELASEEPTIDSSVFSTGDNIFVELTAFDGVSVGNTVASHSATAVD